MDAPLFRQAGTANSHNRSFQLWQQDYHPIELGYKRQTDWPAALHAP
jgi:hypothetical protein